MVHLVVILVAIEDVPFSLNDAILAAYVVTGLGVPIGLASQAAKSALFGLFARVCPTGINPRNIGYIQTVSQGW